MQQQAAARQQDKCGGGFYSFKRWAVFAMKCGGAKARNSMRAYVKVRSDLENRAEKKIKRRGAWRGPKSKAAA